MPNPEVSAREAGLRYVDDDDPGIRRKKWGGGFTYLDPEGNHITGEAERERFEELSIPPAWTDVWICPHENGHLQATGRDDAGRKQHIYHPAWSEVRNRTKFDRLIPFGEALPRLRARCAEDLQQDGLPREKVLAAAVRLLDCTLIRIGHAQYAEHNSSFGLTTLRDRHISFSEDTCTIEFTGKSEKEHHVEVSDGPLARVVKKCRDVSGPTLFQYSDEEQTRQPIDPEDVNGYLRAIADAPITAKDFRTWGGTREAATTLAQLGPAESDQQRTHHLTQAVEAVADRLGNTKSVCREYYIHPRLLDAYREAQLLSAWEKHLPEESAPHFSAEEQATLRLLGDL